MNSLTLIAFLMSMSVLLNACKDDPELFSRVCSGGVTSMTDVDGNTYPVVEIGNQCWIAENLRVSGNMTNVTDQDQWEFLGATESPSWCNYENNSSNDMVYGKLYNWYAVQKGNICPNGWHIPTDAEWQQLIVFLGGDEQAGGKMKATSGWNPPNKGATNNSGFTALPGGKRNNDGGFSHIGENAYFWSTTDTFNYDAWYHFLDNSVTNVYRDPNDKRWGLSCRCLRD